MSQYKAEYPSGVTVDDDIVLFLERFYEVSDTPGAHDAYVDQFTSDATFKLGSKTSQGRDEITTMRHGMWTAVAQRKHTVYKIFPFGSDSQEVMLYGSVEYELRAGDKATVEWGGRAVLEKSTEDGKYRMKFYQVYLDPAGATKK
ncbi:hypothetical protein BKA67DRAFT_132206 [Truncatella angustata]|uniref:Uncharacterized protein n=1 Tax=Truncatella angustata TaxID=152316 RepID=A0A9P8RI15_9PEZI|nr:uncharacterized protein BKA67DRAFT_132206 [Truncatella angustata]KAH6643297.1 hypothetical protein BKA67DRAFT_132206 [Truncatella angustata]